MSILQTTHPGTNCQPPMRPHRFEYWNSRAGSREPTEARSQPLLLVWSLTLRLSVLAFRISAFGFRISPLWPHARKPEVTSGMSRVADGVLDQARRWGGFRCRSCIIVGETQTVKPLWGRVEYWNSRAESREPTEARSPPLLLVWLLTLRLSVLAFRISAFGFRISPLWPHARKPEVTSGMSRVTGAFSC